MSYLSLPPSLSQELEKRRKAERAAHSAINGTRAMAYEYSGPDLQVKGILLVPQWAMNIVACVFASKRKLAVLIMNTIISLLNLL